MKEVRKYVRLQKEARTPFRYMQVSYHAKQAHCWAFSRARSDERADHARFLGLIQHNKARGNLRCKRRGPHYGEITGVQLPPPVGVIRASSVCVS